MSSICGVSSRFEKILRLAEQFPIRALRKWLAETDYSISRVMLDTHSRALSRIVAKAITRVDPAHARELDSLIGEAWRRIESMKKVAGRPVGLGFTLSGAQSGSVMIGDTMPSIQRQPRHSPDLADLNRQSKEWSNKEWMQWLHRGLATIQANQKGSHLSFPPLRLYPVGRYVEQLAAALVEAVEFGSTMRERVLEALGNQLSRARQAEPIDELLWRLFRLLGPKDPIATIARDYVTSVVIKGGNDLPHPIARELCEAASQGIVEPAARSSFFERLVERVSAPIVRAELIVANLAEATSEKEFGREELQIAATTSLQHWSHEPHLIGEHIDILIKGGRFPRLHTEPRIKINNSRDLYEQLTSLAKDYRPLNVIECIPPPPRALAEINLAKLTERLDGV